MIYILRRGLYYSKSALKRLIINNIRLENNILMKQCNFISACNYGFDKTRSPGTIQMLSGFADYQLSEGSCYRNIVDLNIFNKTVIMYVCYLSVKHNFKSPLLKYFITKLNNSLIPTNLLFEN